MPFIYLAIGEYLGLWPYFAILLAVTFCNDWSIHVDRSMTAAPRYILVLSKSTTILSMLIRPSASRIYPQPSDLIHAFAFFYFRCLPCLFLPIRPRFAFLSFSYFYIVFCYYRTKVEHCIEVEQAWPSTLTSALFIKCLAFDADVDVARCVSLSLKIRDDPAHVLGLFPC